jgi:hypothetical protein
MLWKLVDVLAILGALALLVLFGPEVLGLKNWRRRKLLASREPDQSNASPSRESSSSK